VGGRHLEVPEMFKNQARGYFGIEAKAYGFTGHVDTKYLKVPSAHHIFQCANEMNNFNDGWYTTLFPICSNPNPNPSNLNPRSKPCILYGTLLSPPFSPKLLNLPPSL